MPDPHLLLVDDSFDVRTIVTYLCKRAGYRLDACHGVEPAWEFLQNAQPQLILLDVQMPPVSGIELCHRVRASAEPLRTTPIALFTHWGVPGDVVAGLEAGADYVVSKDLLADPAKWQRRVSEIFRHLAGLSAGSLVTYSHRVGNSLAPPTTWSDVLNQGLLRVMVRLVGTEVARTVVHRALRQAAVDWPDAFAQAPNEAASAAAFPPEWPQLIRRPEAVFLLAGALHDCFERLLGTEESATFRTALAPLLVGPGDRQPQ